MNEPIGRLGSCRPARARRTAVGDRRRTASSWPTTRLASALLHVQQLVALALEHPLDRNAGPARDDCGDLVGVDLLLHHRRPWPLRRLSSAFELLLQRRDLAVRELAGAREIAAALRLLQLGALLVELLLELLGRAELALLAFPAARSAPCSSPRARRSTCRACVEPVLGRRVVSLRRASRSICSCIRSRSISSSSSGLESISMRRRDAASSTRSMALSGRKRSVM